MLTHQMYATQAVDKLDSGEVTAEQLFTDLQVRINELNPRLKAFTAVNQTPQPVGRDTLLKGLPISIKDQIHVAGLPCTSGYEELKGFVPAEDAQVVHLLKAAGAQILGKTNLPPLAQDFQSSNSLFGQTINPWNPAYTPGGSTGGGAAAVAAGLSFVEIGADLAGSIRIPASFCGLYGFIPTADRLPLDGTMTLLEQAQKTIEHLPRVGMLARQVEDLALIWQALSGERPAAHALSRVAICPPHEQLPLHPAVASAMKQLRLQLRQLPGLEVIEAQPAGFDWKSAWAAYGVIQGYQVGAMMNPLQRLLSRLMSRQAMRRSPNFIRPIQDGYRRKKAAYLHALAIRKRLTQSVDEFIAENRVWILPVTLVPAFKHIAPSFERGFLRDYDHFFEYEGSRVNYFEALTRLTTPFNLTGHPVVTIPVTHDAESGVPIGVQLVGQRHRDEDLLALAAAIQNRLGKFSYPMVSDPI